MSGHVCPWWLGWLLASPIRRLAQDPVRILSPHVRPGMTILEPGPGMGFFTLELARLAGPAGRVVAVDVQPRMLAGLQRRAARAGLGQTIETRLARGASLGVADLAGQVDFLLAFAMVHELPDVNAFFSEAATVLKAGGRLLLAEPRGHVRAAAFEGQLTAAAAAGLRLAERPDIGRSHAALLVKGRPS